MNTSGPTRKLSAGLDEPLTSIGEAAIDRMPALSRIFEEAAANFTRGLGEYGALPVAVALEEIKACRLGDLDEGGSPPRLLHVYRASGLDAKAAVFIDSACCALFLELMLGSNIVAPVTERSMTQIEDRIIAFAISRLLVELAGSLRSLCDVSFHWDVRAEEAGFAAVGLKSAVVILVRLSILAIDTRGEIAIAIPRAALDPFRAVLSRLPGAEGQARDEKWSENLYDHIVRTDIKVDVKIETRSFTLGDVAQLEIGDVLRLPIAPTSPIRVVSEGRTLFWCTLGQKDAYYTVRLEDFSDERESFIENILGV